MPKKPRVKAALTPKPKPEPKSQSITIGQDQEINIRVVQQNRKPVERAAPKGRDEMFKQLMGFDIDIKIQQIEDQQAAIVAKRREQIRLAQRQASLKNRPVMPSLRPGGLSGGESSPRRNLRHRVTFNLDLDLLQEY